MGQEFEAQALNQHATSPANSLTQNVGKENDLTSMELSLGLGPPLVQSLASSTLQNPLLNPTGLSTSILNAKSPSNSSRKRIRKEVENFGRNIKQRLCGGGGVDKEIYNSVYIPPQEFLTVLSTSLVHEDPNEGCWEAGLQELPQQP